MEGKRGSECLLKPVSNIDFNPVTNSDNNDVFFELFAFKMIHYSVLSVFFLNLYTKIDFLENFATEPD